MQDSNNQSVNIAFDALRLHSGATMYIQSQSDGAHVRHKVQFIGFIKGKSLLVTLPFEDGKGLWMQSGQTFVIRGFNGIYAYGFSAQVTRARAHPFPYIHFSWPREVGGQLVRKSLRVEVALSATVTLPDSSMVNVTMLDLSALGSMLDSPTALGAVGEHARIGFTVDFEGSSICLDFAATVRNIYKKDDGTGFRIGIGFEQVVKNDALVMHYFINNIALDSKP